MIIKEWYVLHQAQKYGPFAQKQILEMLKTGSMMRSQKIWREGLSEPITSYDLFLHSVKGQSATKSQFKSLSKPKIETRVQPVLAVASKSLAEKVDHAIEGVDLEMPPPLPPIPSSSGSPLPIKPEQKVQTAADPERAETSTEILNEVESFKQLSGVQDFALPPLPPEVIYRENSKKRQRALLKYVMLGAGSIISLLLLYFVIHDLYLVKFNKASRPRFVDIKDYKLLSRVHKKNIAQNTVAILTSKDSESLVLATNFIYDADLEIELKSQDSKVLSNEKIELEASAKLVSGLAHFSDLNFKKGDKIYPGYYSVKLRSKKELRRLYWYDKWFPAPQKLVMEDLSIFLGHLPLKIYKKKMTRFLRKRNRKEKQFLGDLDQKWLTLTGIVKQLKQELINLMEVPSQIWKTKVRVFEKKYTKVYGSFFTEFYLNNQQVQKQLKKSDIRQLEEFNSQYRKLSKIAQAVGKKTVEIIERSSVFNFAPNTEARADMTSSILKNSDRFLERIKTGQMLFNDLQESVEALDDSDS